MGFPPLPQNSQEIEEGAEDWTHQPEPYPPPLIGMPWVWNI